jgi:flagellar hook assembly protein FlgD
VRTLVDEPKRAGNYEVVWDGKDDKGKDVGSGIYFYQLKAGDYTETKKMILVK